MKPIVALSTCWLSQRHNDGHAMLVEAAALGFEWVELSHGVRISLVPGILAALQEGVVRVSTVHNFCPLPTGITQAAPNLYMPTSADPRERTQWLRHTRRTIDFAKQVGARVVVLHLGRIEFFWLNPARKLRRYLHRAGARFDPASPAYRALLAVVLAKFRKRSGPFLERMRSALEAVIPYAEERGIRLGLENREKLEEMPFDADFPALIGSLPRPGAAGYWHDVGHGQIKQNAGVVTGAQLLSDNAPHLLGFHIHDVDSTGHDHLALGAGTVDFTAVARFFRPEHVLVFEFGPRVTRDEVVASKARLDGLIAEI